jgi:hypothetical protein
MGALTGRFAIPQLPDFHHAEASPRLEPEAGRTAADYGLGISALLAVRGNDP